MYEDFKEDFISEYGKEYLEQVEKIVDYILSENDYYHDYKYLELEGFETSLEIEKHDALNFTYFINISNEAINLEVYLVFYTGVNVGCELVEYSLEGGSPSLYVEKEILSDLELDEEKVKEHFLSTKGLLGDNIPNDFIIDNLMRKARIVFENNKSDIMELYAKENYDSYVTGGGTNITSDYYEKEFNKYHEIGLFWKKVYKTELCDRNIR